MPDGDEIGELDGIMLGELLGTVDGVPDGELIGDSVGLVLGEKLGTSDGKRLGGEEIDGFILGYCDMDGLEEIDGIELGVSLGSVEMY